MKPRNASVFTFLVLSVGAGGVGGEIEREDVAFSINHITVLGQSVYVLGNIPELGNNDPARAVKLEPSAYPLWRAAVAIPAGTSYTYQFTWRNDAVNQWSNAANHNPIGSPISTSTAPGDPRPTRKGLYYHSGWNSPMLVWRIGAGAYTAVPMDRFGPGRSPAESRWRALGLGQAERKIEFYFTDGGAGRDPATGTYATALDAFFVQDGHVFDYVPPPALSPPQQINVSTFFSTILAENRPYRILLPRGYAQNTAHTYPVLYMHDGQNVFDFGPFGTWNADETTIARTKAGAIREIIIVAIDNTANRGRNYVPPDDITPIGPGSGQPGQADDYVSFIISELMPVIDSTYRTRTGREDTATIGSSLGGVVSLYMGWDYDDVFGRCAAMSGSWQLPNFPNRVRSEPFRELRIYLDSGDSGTSNDNAWPTMSLRDGLPPKGYVLHCDLYHTVGYGQQHNEAAWAARLPGALEYLFPAVESDNSLRVEMFVGDLDGDADMDEADFAQLADCLGGPDSALPLSCQAGADADLDADGDVDLRDFGIFAAFFTGAL